MKNYAALLGVLALLATPVHASDAARYDTLEPDRFLTRWLVLSPVSLAQNGLPDEARQQEAFAQDLLRAVGGEAGVEPIPGQDAHVLGQRAQWRLLSSTTDAMDLDGKKNEFSVAYAYAEVESSQPVRAVLGIGSDDAIKVWVNGALVHEKWAGRPVRADEDLVGVDLRQGRNRLLLKIQNMQADWGFAFRAIGPPQTAKRLVAAARSGDLETVALLLDHGADPEARGLGGLTAVQAATLHGRMDVVDLLRNKGVSPSAPLPSRATLVDALLSSAFKPDRPGAAVLVAKGGDVLFEKAYGLSDVERRVAAVPRTKFRIGSVTKQFTAAAILKLHEHGKLGLQDKLSKFIPDYPRGGEVTIHHLLTHTSGIHSFTSKPDFYATVTEKTKPGPQIASFKNDPYDFSPGEQWSYNNSGYFLLGYIVEKVSGQSYADYLRQTFFKPLGMHDTGFHERTGVLKDEALGYSFAGEQATRAVDWSMSRAGGAGALYSTVRDLYLWNEALHGGKVLGAASLEAAFSPVSTRDESASGVKDTGYGYGFSLQRLRDAREVSHGGGFPGFSSYLLRLPDSQLTVAVLLNSLPAPPGVDAAVLARDIAELWVGDTLAAREVPRIDPNVPSAALDAVQGSYDLGGATLAITREGNRMFAQIAGQARNEIFPKSETAFFLKERDRHITFAKDAQGRVTKAVLTNQTGFSVSAARKAEQKPVAIDPRTYDGFTGRFDYGGAILTVTREGDRLLAQLSGQPRFEIFPKSDTTFFWKVVSAEVTFVKDDKGIVTRALHKQGGQSIDAPRVADVEEARVDPALYDAYVGRYDYGQAIMTVTREGDRLFAQMVGQPKFEIFPKSETAFFWKVVNAEIRFIKDGSGKVVKAIHEQGGKRIEVPRLK